MAIASIGVGSGLPIAELLDNLRMSENVALAAIESRQQVQQARISAYGKLQSSLEGLADFSKKLSGDDTFNALSVNTDSSAFEVSTSSKAVEGHYQIKVDQLARSQTLIAAGQASATEHIGAPDDAGQISFTIGGEVTTIELESGKASLQDVVKAINASSDLKVQATIVNDGNSYRLMLSTTQTGTEAQITDISVTGNTQLAGLFNMGAMTEEVARDARFYVNGIEITSQTNNVDNVIEGVTFTLKQTNEAAEAMSLVKNNEVAVDAIKGFVDAYNSLQDVIKDLTSYDFENSRQSALTGDSTARNVQSRMSQLMHTVGGGDVIKTLADLGVTTDFTNGRLLIDEGKLNDALTNHGADVQALFQGENGIASRLEELSKPFLDSQDGTFKVVRESAERALRTLDDQFIQTEMRIEDRMEVYRRQFIELDRLMSEMSGLSGYLAQQLASLNSISNKS